MADYKKMYLTLFNAITTAIEQARSLQVDRAVETLIQGQQETEELYLEGEDTK